VSSIAMLVAPSHGSVMRSRQFMLGAPKWPPNPQRSGRPGKPVGPLGLALALGAPLEVRLAGGARLVEASYGRRHRRRGGDGGILLRFAGDLDHRIADRGERLLGLGFRRLDHQRLL